MGQFFKKDKKKQENILKGRKFKDKKICGREIIDFRELADIYFHRLMAIPCTD